jgi:hypothetical protein
MTRFSEVRHSPHAYRDRMPTESVLIIAMGSASNGRRRTDDDTEQPRTAGYDG